MQEVANTQTNWLKLNDNNTVELSDMTFDSLMAFIGADEAIAA
jgi:hypothetical protein